MKNIKLLHGDCLELMKSIPDKSVGLEFKYTKPIKNIKACSISRTHKK